MPADFPPLCYRCEQRARYHETGSALRCECGDVGQAVWSCYAYRPVQPLVLARNEGDPRPALAGWMLSARAHAVGLADVELDAERLPDGAFYSFWRSRASMGVWRALRYHLAWVRDQAWRRFTWWVVCVTDGRVQFWPFGSWRTLYISESDDAWALRWWRMQIMRLKWREDW